MNVEQSTKNLEVLYQRLAHLQETVIALLWISPNLFPEAVKELITTSTILRLTAQELYQHNEELIKSIEVDKIWQLEENKILKQQVEKLKIELCYKNNELRLIHKLICTEDDLYRIVLTMLLNIDDTEHLTENLLVCDQLLQNTLAELQNAVDIYNSSVSE